MEISIEQYDRIQQYLDGELSAQQQASFLQDLEKDEDLMDAWQTERYIRQTAASLNQAGEIARLSKGPFNVFTEKMSEEDENIRRIIEDAGRQWKERTGYVPVPPAEPVQPAAKIISFRRTMLAAAACIVLILGSLAIWRSVNQQSLQPS